MYTSTTYTDPGRVGEMPVAGVKSLYRREFDEMENRIRKCERERAELERKFADLMRERAECERATARAMKQRHKRMAEAERQRVERNESILRMLNKVDLQAASLAAKTDRLKMLKTQYEMYLMRTWSSTAQSYQTATPVAAIMAPPAAPSLLTASSRAAPKSEFVQYLSDLTHQQTANVNPIPPPTALSNYIAANQKSPYQLNSTGYGLGIKDDFLPTRINTERSLTLPGDGVEAPPDRTKAKRFEMSNEDFIRYIDSEVLKEPPPVPKVNVQAPPSPEADPKQEQKNTTAYLEDVTVSEDEQQQQREPVGRLSEPLDQFSIIVDQAASGEDKPVSGEEYVEETLPKTASEVEKDTDDHQTPNENLESSDTVGVTSDVVTEHPTLDPIIAEAAKDYVATGDTLSHENNSFTQSYLDEPSKKSEDVPAEPEHRAPTAVTFSEETLDYPAEQEEHQVYQQQPGYAEDYVSSEGYYNETLPDNTYATGAELNAYGETAQPHATNQYYNQEQMYDTLPASSVPPAVGQPTQPPAGNPHWGMARQAMRARNFPLVKSKPPSPEQQAELAETAYESVAASVSEAANVEQTQSEYTDQAVSGEGGGAGVYAPYSEQPVQDGAQATIQDHEASAMVEQYHQEGGQSIAYPEGQYDASQPVDTHQATIDPQYQYQTADGLAYQEGQYPAEAGSTDQSAYQYQEGTDQSMANQYAAGDGGYGDPNQQYQYDAQNAQYYTDQQQQQQQQGYESQYYSEDQQQQQYYMEDPNQQPGDPGQYEAQQTAEGYQASQEYYAATATAAAADEQQYQADPAQQSSAEPDTTSPIHGDDAGVVANPIVQEVSAAQSSTDDEPPPSVNTGAVASKSIPEPVVDKKTESSKPSVAQQPPAGKGPAPATQVPVADSPIVSSANDESDFDFSTQ